MVLLQAALSLFPLATLASVSVGDPSDVIDPADWAADNALVADYNVAVPGSQPSDSTTN